MSLSKKQQAASTAHMEWDGTALEANVDDVLLLREVLDLENAISDISHAEALTDKEKIEMLATFAEQTVALVERVFGDGTAAQLWGKRVPMFEALMFANELAVIMGKAYDAMFAEYKKTASA